MSDIFKLIEFEEGWRDTPYVDSLGYPTTGFGFRLGPQITGPNKKNTCAMLYDFKLPKAAGVAWLEVLLDQIHNDMLDNPRIKNALDACAVEVIPHNQRFEWQTNPRQAVLVSMAYQMGINGLANFRNTLSCVVAHDWFQVETQMLKSRWASQTPNRAKRHAAQMRTGTWYSGY